jgi:threonine dehydratase
VSTVTAADVRAARERIRDDVVLTPCTPSRGFGDLVRGRLYFKFENLQRTGSFKDRGSLNRLLHLTPEERARGVVTASAGNHAQALAHHAARLGIPATVVMPENAPLIKVSNTKSYGARVLQHGAILDDAAVEARRLVEEEGLVMVHPFNDPRVIAGQGSVGLEIAEQVPDVDVVVVPVGGGGLISGIAVALADARPGTRIVGVEAEAAPSAKASREAGELVKITSSDTLADGIATKQVGDLTFRLMEEGVHDLVTVSEDEIASAILLLLERKKTVVEGGGAVGLAALVGGKVPVSEDDTVVVVLSGGNIDVNIVSRIIERGLVADGRLVRLAVRVSDRPGSLSILTRTVAELGASVLDIHQRRAFADIRVSEVEIVMHLETRGRAHAEEVMEALGALGFMVAEHL